MKVIVFSKDRAMQLDAYLQSLKHHTGTIDFDIFIITPQKNEYYSRIDGNYNWIYESDHGSFHNAFKHVINEIGSDNILFGCDDVVYINSIDVYETSKILTDLGDPVAGFSLRLGRNIIGINHCGVQDNLMLWRWHGQMSHWGYAFDLMASMYHSSMIKDITRGNNFRCPNDLESAGVHWFIRHIPMTYMAAYLSDNFAIAQDVNRVQDLYPNRIQGDENQSIDTINRLWLDGWKIDWKSLAGIKPDDVFVGNKYWKLIKNG